LFCVLTIMGNIIVCTDNNGKQLFCALTIMGNIIVVCTDNNAN